MKKIKVLWIFAGVLILANIIVYSTRWGGEQFLTAFSNFLPVLCSLVASVSLYNTFGVFKKFDFAKTVWLLLFLGITLNFFAETIYAVTEVIYKKDMNDIFPFVADYFWCIAYIPIIIGLSVMLWKYKNSGLPLGNMKLYGVITVASLGVLTFIIFYLLVPIIKDPATDNLSKAFYLYYPIADIFSAIPALLLMYITSLFGSGKLSRPWLLLALGFLFNTLGDLTYSYLSWQDTYSGGNFIDIAWNIGYMLIAISGLYQQQLIKSFNVGGSK